MTEETGKTAVKNKSLKAFILHFFEKDAPEGYVPNRELFAYAAALAGQNMDYGIVSGWMFYFCTNVLKIDPLHVGTIMLISRIWDGVNDPIVGTLIDRIPPKNGYKLHRYLGKLALVIGFLTVLLFCDPGLGEMGKIAWVLIVYLLWDMAYSFQDVGLWGTLPLISPIAEERTRAAQWVTIGAQASGLLTGLIPILMDVSGQAGWPEKYLFFCFALVLGLGGESLSMLALKTRERIAHPPADKNESFFRQLAQIRHNKILVALFLAQMMGSLSITLPWIYFFKYGLVGYTIRGGFIGGETVMAIYGPLSGLPGVFSLFVAPQLMKKLGGPKKALMFIQFLAIGVRLVCFFIGYDTPLKLSLVVLIMAASSIPSAIGGIVNRSFLCDSVDYMEWRTGRRTEGLVSSMQNFVAKINGALQGYINGLVLHVLHFDQTLDGITGQPPEFYKWQWPLFMFGPAIGAICYLIPMLFLKYTDEERARVESDLAVKHAAAKTAAEESAEQI